MKTIGLIGGMSWESTRDYYRIINEGVGKRLGKLHSAKIVIYSIDFDPLAQLQNKGDWKGAAKVMMDAAQKVERGGANFLLICANTMHKIAGEVEKNIKIPILNIIDTTAKAIEKKGFKKVALLGTGFTMEDGFYQKRMERFDIEIVVPTNEERKFVHESIYKELCFGKLSPETKSKYLKIIDKLVGQGAQGVILGCTEIPLLIKENDCQAPLFNTTKLHAVAAVDEALK